MTNIPEGWKLVPTTATPERVRAWRSKAVNASFSDAAYQAMLAAAQQPVLSKPPWLQPGA